MTMRLKLVRRPGLRMRVLPVLRANVSGGNGISVAFANGSYAVSIADGFLPRFGALGSEIIAADTVDEVVAIFKLYTRRVRVLTSSAVTISADDDIVVINRGAGGDVSVALPPVSSATGREKIVYRWDAYGGTVSFSPHGSEAVNGRSGAWSLQSLAGPGGGGAIHIIPVTALSGWLIKS
ncbi:hypothetical protein RHODGE_RHODGE_03972 [Rhodoplanes serenus]|uniref:Uncharacterized protein n=1 Tax=Rhodoplanes serenus TaxID=200615 RepID=A0A447CZU7_9BRAD|nr:hypothetical protein [Rhodoplanes serenus]VCU10768.1 hypothetical protein RHODGE_RHODGE_03972 [Rhodoplanes serenus]